MTAKKTPPAKKPAKAKAKATPQVEPKKAATPAKKAVPVPKKATPVTRHPPEKKAPPPKGKKTPAKAKPVDDDADTPDDGDLCGLSPRAARMIDLYLATMQVGQSYIEAGYHAKNPNVAQAGGSRLLGSVKGRAYLNKRSKAMFDRLEEEQDRLLQSFTFTAFADSRELVEHRRGACRYCWGKFHRYQFTAGEWDMRITQHAEKQEKAAEEGKPVKLKAPDPKGGTGFNRNADPNPDCPECGGDGEGRTVVKDTRNLSPAALALYAGVKEGKDGIEVKMHDQMKARDTLAKMRKMYEDSTPINVSVDATELAAKFGAGMAAAHAQMEKMRKERQKMREDDANGT